MQCFFYLNFYIFTAQIDFQAILSLAKIGDLMTIVNMHQAKSQLSKLIIEASKGNDVVIARDGLPVAKLIAIKGQKRQTRKKKGWSATILAFKGIDEFESFESFRDYQEPKDPIL